MSFSNESVCPFTGFIARIDHLVLFFGSRKRRNRGGDGGGLILGCTSNVSRVENKDKGDLYDQD